MQDPQVLLRRPLRLPLDQHVVGQAEVARREQILAVTVVRERPRLADQPVDHMPIFDPMFGTAAQSRQRLHQTLRVPHLDALRVESGLHPLTDQPARHGVNVAEDMDGAAPVHPHAQPLAGLQPPRRQRLEQRQLLSQPLLPARVELLEQTTQERRVLRPVGKVPAAAQQQGLVQRPLELPVALLHVAVLVGLPRLDCLALQSVVPQQRLVTLRERSRTLCPRRDRRRQTIRPVQLRHAAQFRQGVLQAFAQALVALGEADGPRLPVRVGQHKVVNQMVERRAVDGHAQLGAMREIAGAQASGVMDLGEEYLLGRSLKGTPLLEAALQGPQLAVGEAPRKAALQIGKQGLGLQSWVECQLRFQLRPDLGEGVRSRAVVTVHAAHLAGQPTEPAVLARGLGVDAGLVGRASLGQSLEIEPLESSHLLIGEHPEPPVRVGSG